MRLRRLTDHLRTQNWTGVGLDFLIVVVGVFIGIQMSNWNEERKENAVQQIYLEQLVADLEEIEARASDHSRLYADRVLATNRIMDFLRSATNDPADSVEFDRDLGRIGRMTPAVARSPTVTELVSSGRLGLIAAPELRLEIVRFDQAMQAGERAAEVISEVLREESSPLFRNVTFVLEVSEDGRELLSSQAEYDLEAMRMDPALLRSLSNVLFMHLMEVEWRSTIAEHAADLRARLEEGR